MLRLVVILSSVVAISGAFLPTLFRREGAGRPCIALASAIQDMLDWEEEKNPIYNFKDNLQFATGIDPDDSALVQELVCLLVEETGDDFVKALKQKGIEFTLVRRIQNYIVASLDHDSQYFQPGSAVHQLMFLVFQSGFADLDPEGMQEMYEVFEHYGLDHGTVKVPERLTPVTCEEIQASFRVLQPFWRRNIPSQFSDEDVLQFTCDVFLSESIDDIVEVVDAAGVPTLAVNLLKTQIRVAVEDIPRLEASLQDSETWGTDDWVEEYKENQRRYLHVLYAFRDAGMSN